MLIAPLKYQTDIDTGSKKLVTLIDAETLDIKPEDEEAFGFFDDALFDDDYVMTTI